MKILIIIGTVRPRNYTCKAAAIAVRRFCDMSDVQVEVLDLAKYNLNMPGDLAENDSKKLCEKIQSAAGVLIASPEYNGSFPAALKLMIENLGYPSALSQKPAALLGVASGKIGAVKSLEHLRSVMCHIGALVMPRVVSISEVDKVFDENGACKDHTIVKRINVLAEDLYRHAKCISPCQAEEAERFSRG